MQVHGLAKSGNEWAVHFGIALWPYDLLLRFGYDLPENEHVWDGKWFDDRFEQAAFDIRATAAKLMLALSKMDAAASELRAAASAEWRPDEIASFQRLVEEAPLTVDLAAAYLRRAVEAVALIVPNCYGWDGRVLRDERGDLRTLLTSRSLRELDPALAELLAPGGALAEPLARLFGDGGRPGFATHTHDLYVIAEAGGFSAALPRSAARALSASAAETLAAVGLVDESLHFGCGWFDRILSYLQRVVADRSEPGPELLERWAERNWSVLLTLPAGDRSLEGHLPAWEEERGRPAAPPPAVDLGRYR